MPLPALDFPRPAAQEFMAPNYLANWVQSLFNALGSEVQGKTLGLGGDGRYFGKEAAQIIIKLAAGNGFGKVVVGQDAIMATPAMSALIRERGLYGALQSRGTPPTAGRTVWGGCSRLTSGTPPHDDGALRAVVGGGAQVASS